MEKYICSEKKVDKSKIGRLNCDKLTEEKLKELAETFKVLGDLTRVKILYGLLNAELCVCEIMEYTGMSQSAVSHQLRILRTMRLVKYRREGRSIYYSVDDEHVNVLFMQGLEHVEDRS
jgi:DNA-binding transcriptional ArsR family regulator